MLKGENIMMKLIGFLAIACSIVSCCGCQRIDAGHEGILVNQFGSDKGVDDVTLVTGTVFYNPLTKSVYEFPLYVQTVDYPVFAINAKDGTQFNIDPTISLRAISGSTPQIFKKYRKPLDEIIQNTLFNYTKDVFRVELNKHTTDELISKRESFENDVQNALTLVLKNEGFELEQLTSGLQIPVSIIESINSKNKMIQDAMTAENQVKLAEAKAKTKIVEAEAEAKSNNLREKSLTPLLIQQMFIDKWDGKTPLYGDALTLFKNVGQ